MQKNDSQSPLSLSQQAYVLTASLRQIIYSLTGVLIITIGFFFSVGVLIADPLGALVSIIGAISPFLIFTLIKSRHFYEELKIWNKQYLDAAYTLIFSIAIPKGNTNGERVLYLASFIFPQLRADYIDYYYTFNFVERLLKIRFKKSWKKIVNMSLNVRLEKEYYVDVALETLEGFFIVKDFGDKVVSVKDIKDLMMITSNRFRRLDIFSNRFRRLDIFRIIVIAKNYDQQFFNRESLEQMINNELNSKLKIDFIVREEVGYTVLWVS